jgi:hypothetical protein
MNDGKGNINNILDTSNYIPVVSHHTNGTRQDTTQPIAQQPQDKDGYSEYIPKKHEMNTEAPGVPHHYQSQFNINNNTRQMNIGNLDFLQLSEIYDSSENSSFKNITIPPHINL